MTTIGFVLALAFAASGCGQPRTPADEAPPASSTEQDIDVLSDQIDCRRNVGNKTEIDAKCCEENARAAGCGP